MVLILRTSLQILQSLRTKYHIQQSGSLYTFNTRYHYLWRYAHSVPLRKNREIYERFLENKNILYYYY